VPGCPASRSLLHLVVGRHDEEVHDGRDHQERQQRVDEPADVHLEQRHGAEVGPSADLADEAEQHTRERRDHGREGAAHDERGGQLDQVAAHDELLETLDHVLLLDARVREATTLVATA
jgi:hypothetical protein